MQNNSVISTINPEGSDESLKIKKGINDAQINQLIEYSKSDESLKKFTGDPQRFATREGFDEFSTHIMAYYVLTDDTDDLLGLIWFDDFALPATKGETFRGYGISFAIRIYGDARGKGLAIPFTKKALEDFLKTKDYQLKANHGIWLAVSPDNYPAISTYEKSGFKKIGMWEEKNKLLMVL